MPERYIMQLSIAPEVSMEFSAVLLCCGLFRCVHQLLPFGGQRVFRFFEFIGGPAEGAGEFRDAPNTIRIKSAIRMISVKPSDMVNFSFL